MALNDRERNIIHETLGTLAAERVRLNQELNEHVVKSIKLREVERRLGKCYDELAEMLMPSPAVEPQESGK